ncbi:MAG: TRAP transporter small permease [Sagittula sp.]|uniref:TRAP transporter small permease n=1 Tax=Sagittula sp. TaxID=2038081 RepID=UPI00405A3DEA
MRILNSVIDAATVLGAAAVFLMMAHVALDVAGKVLFAKPLPATLAMVSNYYMVVVAFLPLAVAERRDAHIAVEVLTDRFPATVQRVLRGFGTLFSAAVFALLARQAFVEAASKHEVGAFMLEKDVKVLIWPSHYLMAAGCSLMVIALLARIAGAFRTGPDRPAA